jgi:hypothetical protein
MIEHAKFTTKGLDRRMERRSQLKLAHGSKTTALAQEADRIIGCAQLIAHAAEEAAANGTPLQIQPQIAFLTGSLARLIKDWGAVEYLQMVQQTGARRATG